MSEDKIIRQVKFKESVVEIPEDAPHIRVCYIAKRTDFLGYGINLTADVSKPGQYIANIARGSPAEKAGLKKGDRILEINDVNISHETFKEVVQRILKVPEESKLKLVVLDQEAGRHYRNKSITLKKYSAGVRANKGAH